MKAGDGPESYAQNSFYHERIAVETAQGIIREEIIHKLDIQQLSSGLLLQSFNIADFGCSTGPNTFLAIQSMLEAVELKVKSVGGLNSPEFQVFYNDLASNDFNTLFASLPPERRYYAAGVPGSFHRILFPKASLHFVYSSFSLQWLSKVPKPVTDRSSPAWNSGRIHYSGAGKEVLEAYSDQFAEDMDSFLQARAHELVGGGLMALIIPGLTDRTSLSQTTGELRFELLGSCLMEMAKRGLVCQEKVDSFNLPVYFPSMKELEAVIERNGQFSIGRTETLINPMDAITKGNLQHSTSSLRAVSEGIVSKHFGSDFTNELFDEYSKKVADGSFFFDPDILTQKMLVVILKRKVE
ncbi:hypothetical protein ACOSP7_019622 [Xanthoceras sorbifolium]